VGCSRLDVLAALRCRRAAGTGHRSSTSRIEDLLQPEVVPLRVGLPPRGGMPPYGIAICVAVDRRVCTHAQHGLTSYALDVYDAGPVRGARRAL
jgi:hypothetical protein